MQMGDATNLVLILAGEMLKKSEHLLVMGLHPSEIIKGYELACKKALEELESALSDVFHLTLRSHFNLLFRPHNTHTPFSPHSTKSQNRLATCSCCQAVWLRGYPCVPCC